VRRVVALLVLLVTGCGSTAAAPPSGWTGWPRLPAELVLADSPPPLPATGPVGRGALLYHAGAGDVLVLADGRQLRLPAPPRGEGRQGTLAASLSPDGRWLGRRAARFTGDRRYLVRDLDTGIVVTIDAMPLFWSADGRFLALRTDGDTGQAEPGLVVLEPATGARTTADGIPAQLVLPGGALASVIGQSGRSWRMRMQRDDAVHAIDLPFPGDADAECWCPAWGPPRASPGGRRLWLQLGYHNGLVAASGAKSRPRPDDPAGLALVDLVHGTVTLTLELPTGTLLADTGDGLLWRVATPDAQLLVRQDPVTGGRTVVTVAPVGVMVAVPGEVLAYGE
jgi:hypothetical protein